MTRHQTMTPTNLCIMTNATETAFLLLNRSDLSAPVSVEAATGQAVVFTHACPDADGPNQDSAAVIPVNDQSAILVVADGVGGQDSGEIASGLVIHSIADAVNRMLQSEATGPGQDLPDLRGPILDGIEDAGRQIRALDSGAATTVSVVEIRDHAIRTYHVGDSLIMLISNRGRVKLETIAHSPIGHAVESGFMDEAEALTHEERHIVSNTVGDEGMRIEIGSWMPVASQDRILLASDGLSDNLRSGEITESVRRGPLPAAVHELVTRSRERMHLAPESGQPSKPDDLTIICWRRPVKRREKPGKQRSTREDTPDAGDSSTTRQRSAEAAESDDRRAPASMQTADTA